MEPRGRMPWSSVEKLAVVLGFLAVVFALIICFLVRSREAANRVHCVENLHLIGQAVQKFHNVNGHYPPGWVGPNPDGPYTEQAPHVGVFIFLLPHLYAETQQVPQPYFQAELRARTRPATNPDTGEPYAPPSDVPWW